MKNTSQLLKILQHIFRAQARDVAGKVSLTGPIPDLGYWVSTMVQGVRPVLLEQYQLGMLRTLQNLSQRGIVLPSPKDDGMRRYSPGNDAIFGTRGKALYLTITKAQGRALPSKIVMKAPGLNIKTTFDMFNPKIVQAVDMAAFAFCSETMNTATASLKKTIADLRKLMVSSLSKGEATSLLAKRVGKIFADPMRAFRIAVTESARAKMTGQLIAAKESGVVKGKQWLASSDACEQCLALDRKIVRLDQPFYVDPKGGPYAVVMTPPFHPSCFCDMLEVV